MDLNDFLDFLEEADRMHRETGDYIDEVFQNVMHQFERTFRWFTTEAANQYLHAPRRYGNIPPEFRREIFGMLHQLAGGRITVEQLLERLDLMYDNGNGQIEEIFDDEEGQIEPELPNEDAPDSRASSDHSGDVTEPIASSSSSESSSPAVQQQNSTEPKAKVEPNDESDTKLSPFWSKVKSYKCTYPSCGRSFRQNFTLVEHRQRHSNVANSEKQKRSSSLANLGTQKSFKPFYCKWLYCQMKSKRKYEVLRHIQTVHYKLPRKLSPKVKASLNKEEMTSFVGCRVDGNGR